MTRADVRPPDRPVPASDLVGAISPAGRTGAFRKVIFAVAAMSLLLFIAGGLVPCFAVTTLAAGGVNATTGSSDDFGQYLVEHQDDLSPFFSRHAGELLKLATPLLMGLLSTIMLFTMLIGWLVDVLVSRGYAYFFAPAFADFKRSMIYATGRLFLTFFYTLLIGLITVFCLGLVHFAIVISIVMVLVMLVALAAQLVWILYLYRTEIPISAAFYLVLLFAHFVIACLIAGPVVGTRATSLATAFVGNVITPRLQDEVRATKQKLVTAAAARDEIRSKAGVVQNQITAAQTEQLQLRQAIELKKKSDVYVFSQIVRLRAQGDLTSAREQLAGFIAKFPTSPLYTAAQTQLQEIDGQLTTQDTQRKAEQAEAIRVAAQARADLLARAGRGEVTLSEMRQALIGKTRAQVSELLGLPAETGSDRWGYRQQMIVNPVTSEKFGLTIYFQEGSVLSVDYNRGGSVQ